jgi:hypothetical protein
VSTVTSFFSPRFVFLIFFFAPYSAELARDTREEKNNRPCEKNAVGISGRDDEHGESNAVRTNQVTKVFGYHGVFLEASARLGLSTLEM